MRGLTDAAWLSSVRWRDLRHGQASCMLAADVLIAVVSKRPGPSTSASASAGARAGASASAGAGAGALVITSDTHSRLLEGVGVGTPRLPRPHW